MTSLTRKIRRPRPALLRAALSALAGLAVIMVAGCETYHDVDAFVKRPAPVVTATEYRMAPPDIVLITSKRVREINGHVETIRPDGKITLPLLGSVMAAGLTCEEISATLQTMAREYYADADVSLRVAEFRSKKIYVFGEVSLNGPFPYNGANTILGTLAAAQPSRLADPARIQILRPSHDGTIRKRMTINLDKMVKEGDTTLDGVLEEGDIIYVPANAFATVGLALQQVLLPVQPAAATVSGTASVEQNVIGKTYGRSTSPDSQ